MRKKNNLDEMQELKLLKIEHNGVWFSFWGLLAAISIQACLGATPIQLAGEWIVFMLLAFYMVIACIRAGIWDRRLKPTLKTNLIASIIAAAVCGLVYGGANYLNYQDIKGSIATTVIIMVFTLILCFIALQITSYLYKKRVHTLEEKCKNDSKDNNDFKI